MLLRFGAANHYSIREYQELSLTASKAIKDDGPALLTAPSVRQDVLPVALIYGANASGKTNFWAAARTFRRRIIESFRVSAPDEAIPRAPYCLDPDAEEQPTRFDCDFVLDGVRYHYGYEFTEKRFEREWLYSFPEGTRRTLFNRDFKETAISFGKTLKGRNRFIETSLMRENALFLSTAAQASHPQLLPIYEYFRTRFTGIGPGAEDSAPSVEDDFDPRVIRFLKMADTGVVGARVERHSPDEDDKKRYIALRNAIKPFMGDSPATLPDDPGDIVEVFLAHQTRSGKPVDIDLNNESRGTIRLITLLPGLFRALDQGSAIFVDELESSLHTLLCQEIVALFSSPKSNPNGAQLIATTHDTNLLCSDVVRRDQIWFVEKDDGGESHLYPLTDIKTRNTDNLEKGYLKGRFGAIPYFGSVEQLLDIGG
jgi:predicted ATPase